MAVDTAAKRLSMMDMDETMPGMPAPDSTVDAPDRLHLLWLYSGISAGEAVVLLTGLLLMGVGA